MSPPCRTGRELWPHLDPPKGSREVRGVMAWRGPREGARPRLEWEGAELVAPPPPPQQLPRAWARGGDLL